MFAVVLLCSVVARANDKSPCPGPDRLAEVDRWFAEEVWAKVCVMECIKCHKQGGDAEDTRLVLRDPGLTNGGERKKLMAFNRDVFLQAARLTSADKSVLLAKVVGGLDHGGDQILTRDSTGYRILEQFARQANEPTLRSATGIASRSERVAVF